MEIRVLIGCGSCGSSAHEQLKFNYHSNILTLTWECIKLGHWKINTKRQWWCIDMKYFVFLNHILEKYEDSLT